MEHHDKQVILVLDPAGGDSATASELTERYAHSYTIPTTASGQQAADELRRLAADRRDVALILADRATAGTAVLDAARQLHPHARHWRRRRQPASARRMNRTDSLRA
jgi:hypothetical protein